MEEAGENLGAAPVETPLQKAFTAAAAIFRRLNSLRLLSLATAAAAVFKLPRERCWLS